MDKDILNKLKNDDIHRKYKKKKKFMIIISCFGIVLFLFLSFMFLHKTYNKYSKLFTSNIRAGYQISSTVNSSDFEHRKPTIIYDRDHNVIKKLKQNDNSGKYVKSNQLSPVLKKGIVAVEDRRFYLHHGVDPYGTLRALVSSKLGGGVQGGSTLTQQLVKNVVLEDPSITNSRKIKEMVIAQEIEKKYSKKQILEFYLNNISFNHGNYGVDSASHYYFGKPQDKISIAQSAMLIGLINNPVYYDPQNHPEKALDKRNEILSVFKERGIISTNQYNNAIKEPMNLKITPNKLDNDVTNNYAISFAVNDAAIHMMEASGFNFAYWWNNENEKNEYKKRFNEYYMDARQEIMNGGYDIYTNISLPEQNTLQDITNQIMGSYQSRDIEGKLTPQLSISVINNLNGQVQAVQGGRTTDKDQVNRAFLGYHQPGSTAKMLVAYPEAFERGYTPQSIVPDAPGYNYPHNWYNGYRGNVTIREAIKDSINTVPYRLTSETKPMTYINKLTAMNFDNLDPNDANPIVSIGGFTKGVTTTEMASGYSSFTRDGNFISPTNVLKIVNKYNNKDVWDADNKGKPVFSPEASYMSIDSMKTVMAKGGLGADAMPSNFPNVAGKTGTTDNNTDSYFVGMTPYYTIAIWVGNDKTQPLSDDQVALSHKLFKSVSEAFSQQQTIIDFKKPDSIIKEGNNLTVDSSKTSSISKDLGSEVIQIQNQSILDNTKRRNDLAYRIIYHLSLSEEKDREAKVRNILDEIDLSKFKRLNQYQDYLTLINKAKNYNLNVRRINYKNKFNQEIVNKMAQLTLQRQQLKNQKDAKIQANFEQEKANAQKQVNDEKNSKIQSLLQKLNDQQNVVENAYSNNDSDKESQKNKLISIINELRSLGYQQKDINITALQQ